MTNERKEKISIIMNIMSMSQTGIDLKTYCEDQMIIMLKELDTEISQDLFTDVE